MIELQVDGGVARLTLHNRGKQNAISVGMWRELLERLTQLASSDARVLVIQGDGAHFAAGADISEFPSARFTQPAAEQYHSSIAQVLHALQRLPIPSLAVIRGSCVGGGLEIAACCDFRLALATASFGAPIAKLGFPMAPFELLTLVRAFGFQPVRELLLGAELLDATEFATRTGALRVYADDKALAGAAALLEQRLLELPRSVARANKATLRALSEAAFAESALGPLLSTAFAYAESADHQEGINAFFQKRAPKFKT